MDWAAIQIAIVLALLAAILVGFLRERMPPDVVAMCGVGVLLATTILDAEDVLKTFSNSAPITVAAMFVLSAALERTGVIDSLGQAASQAAGRSPVRAIGAMLLGTMLLSAFINNTPVVVILTPVAIALAHSLGMSPSKLLIPLSYATIFGGTCTLIGTSTNIVVDGVAQRYGLAPIGMFEVTAAGLVLGLTGIAYLLLVGRWLLPDREMLSSLVGDRAKRRFLAEVLVPHASPLAGKRLAEAGLTERRNYRVIDLIREGRSRQQELPEITLRAGDRLLLHTGAADIMGLHEAGHLAPHEAAPGVEPVGSRETVIMEGILGPQSRFIGYRIGELDLRRRYGAYLLAIHRQGENLRSNFDQVRLRFGDTLLLEAPPEDLKRLFESRELINLTTPSERPFRRSRAPVAVAAVLLVMVLAAFELLPIAALALMAATAVVAFGCLEADEAYQAIRWRILILIFAMLAVGTAMEKTGAALLIVRQVTDLAAGLGPVALLAAVYFVAMVLTELISNNAVAILLTPIAIGIAGELGVDPRPFAIAVLFAASASFSTPIGYQTNTFVYNAGGYRFADFVRVGLPLNLLFWAVATLVIPLFWPLRGPG